MWVVVVFSPIEVTFKTVTTGLSELTGDREAPVVVVVVFVCLRCLRSSLEMFPRDVWLE